MIRELPDEAACIFHRPFALGDVALVMTVPYGLDSGQELPVPRVAYTMFETDRLPEVWLPYFEGLARVIVPTQTCRDAFEASGVTLPIDVVPLGVNQARYRWTPPQTAEPFDVAHDRPFRFLLPWADWRKGANLTHLAFINEFKLNEPVELLIKSYSQDGQFTGQDPRVRFINEFLSEAEMDALLASAHCGVFASHGEAGPLDAMKLLALGRPIILTGWSGRDDLHGAPGVYRIELDGFEKAAAYGRYFSEMMGEPVDCGSWANPSLESLQAQMRRIYEEWKEWNRDASETISLHARATMNWRQSAKKMLAVLEGVLSCA
jgi:glycosyltransferase involved in cell wall biosynthesis